MFGEHCEILRPADMADFEENVEEMVRMTREAAEVAEDWRKLIQHQAVAYQNLSGAYRSLKKNNLASKGLNLVMSLYRRAVSLFYSQCIQTNLSEW